MGLSRTVVRPGLTPAQCRLRNLTSLRPPNRLGLESSHLLRSLTRFFTVFSGISLAHIAHMLLQRRLNGRLVSNGKCSVVREINVFLYTSARRLIKSGSQNEISPTARGILFLRCPFWSQAYQPSQCRLMDLNSICIATSASEHVSFGERVSTHPRC
jgi:hypothetical protein